MDINKEYTGLLEAFNSVYENQEQLDEITRSMGRRATQYRKDQEQAAHMERVKQHQNKMKNDPEYAEKHKRLTQTHSRREDQKESFNLFDVILEYLVAEGHAETNKEAFAIMANMSAEDIRGIVEATYGGEKPTDIPADTRKVVTNADKSGNTRAYQELLKKNPNYVAAPHLKGV